MKNRPLKHVIALEKTWDEIRNPDTLGNMLLEHGSFCIGSEFNVQNLKQRRDASLPIILFEYFKDKSLDFARSLAVYGKKPQIPSSDLDGILLEIHNHTDLGEGRLTAPYISYVDSRYESNTFSLSDIVSHQTFAGWAVNEFEEKLMLFAGNRLGDFLNNYSIPITTNSIPKIYRELSYVYLCTFGFKEASLFDQEPALRQKELF